MIKGAIFDFDGTLFDSMYVWERIGVKYLLSIGVTPEDGLRQKVKSMSLYQSAVYFNETYKLNKTAEEIMDGINNIVENYYFNDVKPKDGVIDFLNGLKSRNIKMCIATATDKYQIEAALKRCGMYEFFDEIITCGMVGHGKDEPIIYREAMKLLNTDYKSTLVFEDALHAIKTAKSDNYTVVALYDQYEEKNQEEIKKISDFYLGDYSNTDEFWRFLSNK